MTQRITDGMIEARIDTINRMLGHETVPVPYSTIGGVVRASAYGGTGVHRYNNEFGGVSDLFGGYSTKREVYNFLQGMIQALRIVEDQKKALDNPTEN
jgi:hypothetical protein